MNDYRIVEVENSNKIIVEPNRIVEVDKGDTRIVQTANTLKYTSNKMVFVAVSNSAMPISPGDKNVMGTRINDGTVKQWVISTDVPTNLTARIRKSSSYPTFSDFLTLSLIADDYATGAVDIPIQNLDIFTLVVDSNSAAQRITIELFIR